MAAQVDIHIRKQRLALVDGQEVHLGLHGQRIPHGFGAAFEHHQFRALNIKLQEIGGLCVGNVVQPPGFKLFFPHRFT